MNELELPMEDVEKSKKRKPFIGYYKIWVMLTYLSAVSAVVGMFFALSGNVVLAIICLMTCGLCDMLDGPAARRKKRNVKEMNYGLEIDSLADMVSFGVFPVVLGYAVGYEYIFQGGVTIGLIMSIVIAAFYVLAALIRLAYFNVVEMEIQSKKGKRKFYEGLPVTSISMLIPLVYSVCVIFSVSFAMVYPTMLLVTAVAFLSKIKIPKIRGKYLVIFLLIGIPLAVFLVWSIGAGS